MFNKINTQKKFEIITANEEEEEVEEKKTHRFLYGLSVLFILLMWQRENHQEDHTQVM